MPKPIIPATTINFTVGRHMDWQISVANSPTYGFGIMDWIGLTIKVEDNHLRVGGTPTRAGTYQADVLVGNSDGNDQRTITIIVAEVVTPPPVVVRPVIVLPSPINIRGGTNYTANPIEITIRNKPTSARIYSIAVGLDWRFSANGIEIIGSAPSLRNLSPGGSTFNVEFSVFASNSAGSDAKHGRLLYTP